ncbi:MAG TPA: sigma 54-interacting transcriptional regulator [Edaphobacter sp.]|jgi:DNA-binding NtrC family response regulator
MTTFSSFSSGMFSVSPATTGASAKAAAPPQLIGEGPAMQRLLLQIDRIGPHFRTVLVRGEVGTGKELVARALHARSDRAEATFSVCHAARLSGADHEDHHLDLSEAADQGTLFLDGIEEISPEAQQTLLRLLNRKKARIIVSSSQDLRVIAAAGILRQDIYHRLAMVEIALEPLRRRIEDIPALAMHFLERFAARYQKNLESIAPDAMESLLLHEWPGNVREFENILHNGVLQCEGSVLGIRDLPFLAAGTGAVHPVELQQSEAPLRLQVVIERHVLRVLRECSGNKVRAAEVLGISRSTLYRMLEGRSEQTSGPAI